MKKFYKIRNEYINISNAFSKHIVWSYSEKFHIKTYDDILDLKTAYRLKVNERLDRIIFFILRDNYLLVNKEYYNNIEYLCSLFKCNDYMINHGIHELYKLNNNILKL